MISSNFILNGQNLLVCTPPDLTKNAMRNSVVRHLYSIDVNNLYIYVSRTEQSIVFIDNFYLVHRFLKLV